LRICATELRIGLFAPKGTPRATVDRLSGIAADLAMSARMVTAVISCALL
jgi:hypothetical protein